MTITQVVILLVAGFAAGAINAVAGGGSFFTFAALVAAGLPTIDANATSAAALAPSNVAIAIGYRAELRAFFRDIALFSGLGLAGGGVGAYLLIVLGDAGFRPLVPWLLLIATLTYIFSNRLRAVLAPWVGLNNASARVFAFVAMGLVSIYGGFFGAGMGIMMLAALAILEGGDYHRANAIKNIVAMLIQAISAIILIAGGLVHWWEAFVVMLSSVAGGYLGIAFARRVPPAAVRAIVIAAGTVLTVVFFLRS
jgi:uncharacterized protein